MKRQTGIARWKWKLGLLLLFVCLILAFGWIRNNRRQSDLSDLLKFDAAISAHYGEYQFNDRLIDSGDGLILKIGRGQRVMGVISITDDPPLPLQWVKPVCGEYSFAKVSEIIINDSRFTDQDVGLLLTFPELKELVLSGTAITDEALNEIATLDQLLRLDLRDTQVTEKGLRKLVHCRKLRDLDITHTRASSRVKDYLEAQLPDCRIYW
ncbi:MAG: hypothetical protein NXI29_23920 [bacterium]|nr:hypothetical protein [bacterium]